jgi:hypothetical protein
MLSSSGKRMLRTRFERLYPILEGESVIADLVVVNSIIEKELRRRKKATEVQVTSRTFLFMLGAFASVVLVSWGNLYNKMET